MLVEASERVVESLLALRDDVGVLAEEPQQSDLISEPFCDDRLVLVVPPRDAWVRRSRVSLRELANELFIHREPGSTTRALIERRMKELDIRLNVTMELASNEAIIRSVAMGHGISLVSATVAAPELERRSVVVVRTIEAAVSRRFYLVYHRDRRSAPVVGAVLEIARNLRRQV